MTGRLLAVLWIFIAALAMPFVASAQSVSARFTALDEAGKFQAPARDMSDPTLSRQVVRAAPVADIRFLPDRKDGHAAPGSAPFILPANASLLQITDGRSLSGRVVRQIPRRGPDVHIRVRAPPSGSF